MRTIICLLVVASFLGCNTASEPVFSPLPVTKSPAPSPVFIPQPVGSLPTSTPTSQPSTISSITTVRSEKVMLFVGAGTWAAEISSLEQILANHNISYQTVTSAQLNAMTLDQVSQFGLMIFPGGSGGTEADSLTSATHKILREAVQVNGVSYLGFCAGAFIAVGPKPAVGKDVTYGLGIVDGPELDYYYIEYSGIDISMTKESFPDGSTRDLLWYGGPTTPNGVGEVIAKYPNGDAAISEMFSGNGFVILSAVHPSASDAVKSSLGVSDSDGSDVDLAWKLIESALKVTPLPTF